MNKFDKIVADDNSTRWLKNQQMLPSQWGLSSTAMASIRGLHIALRVFESPSFVYDFSLYPVVNGGVLHLVFFDAELVTRLKVSQKQAIAIFLHEIGHVANRGGKSIGDEHDADAFAVKCGFGEHLASGLEHLKTSNTPYFHTPEMTERISRLRKTSPGDPKD